jgi:hypothetical protein
MRRKMEDLETTQEISITEPAKNTLALSTKQTQKSDELNLKRHLYTKHVRNDMKTPA